MDKKLSLYGNKVVEENIRQFVTKKVPNFSSLSVGDKKIVMDKLVRGCRNCSLAYETQYKPIPPEINPNSFAVFIGRSPCRTEAMENQLYPKGTNVGSLFDKYLSILGLGKTEVSVINMVNCYTLNNRPPTQQCINKCVAYKRFEFELIGNQFKIIFLMGNDACRWMFGLNAPGVLSTLGEIYTVSMNNRDVVVVPVIHPSHLLIQPEYKKDVHRLLTSVRGVINNLRQERKEN